MQADTAAAAAAAAAAAEEEASLRLYQGVQPDRAAVHDQSVQCRQTQQQWRRRPLPDPTKEFNLIAQQSMTSPSNAGRHSSRGGGGGGGGLSHSLPRSST